MLKDGTFTRLFIKFAVLSLRAVAPSSIIYCCSRVARWSPQWLPPSVTLLLDIYATCETLLYLVVYLPRKYSFNRPAPPHSPWTRTTRRDFHAKSWGATYDVTTYISQWFYGAALESIGREDIKDFLLWRYWNRTTRLPEDEEELDEYADDVEQIFGHKFVAGRTGVRSMMVTFEPLEMLHRPLVWYLFLVGGAELQAWVMMLYYGFKHYRVPFLQLLSSFPFRWPALLSSYHSPTKHMSYWYHPHTNADASPVLFIHGIGIGMHTYVNFFKELIDTGTGIGIIAIEILPICSRICSYPVPTESEIAEQVSQILQHHNWTRCVLVTHSYGSVNAAHLLRNPQTTNVIEHCVFVDPVAFSFHAPAIAYNFLRRRPVSASEVELHYFACTDPDVVRALTRSFIWPYNSLWREDVEDRVTGTGKNERRLKSTVMICGKDIITDTVTLGRYMTRNPRRGVKWYREPAPTYDDDAWRHQLWTGDLPVEVVWFPHLNHAEIFDAASDRAGMIKVVRGYALDR